ncbi:carboxymuconolactone decarboxylase family protein [bacterium]|nr:carboxymuconolactone decarboxylase family protein [bacterium]
MDVKKKLDRCEEVFGEMGKNVLDSISDLSPRTVNHVHDYFANNLYSDQTLTSKTRELCVISIIAAQGGLNKPLEVHIRTALNQGVTQEEIVAVLETVGSYAGMPKSISALIVAKSVFEE